jgi:hypothetical protein
MEVIRFTVKLNKDDWLSFSKVVNRRLTRLAKANSKLFIINLLTWIPMGFALAAYSAMYQKYPFLTDDLNVIGGSIVIGAVLLVISLVIRNRIYRKVVVANNGSVLSEHEFIAAPSELRVTGPFGSTVYPWGCFIDHLEENGVVYLFMDNAQALIIPMRNIGAEKDVASLQRWINAEQP